MQALRGGVIYDAMCGFDCDVRRRADGVDDASEEGRRTYKMTEKTV